MTTAIWSIVIFFAIMIQLVVGTVRTILMIKSRRLLAIIIGFFESAIALTIAITVVSQAVERGINVFMILSYAAGFSLGLYFGMLLSEKISKDQLSINIISKKYGNEIEKTLRENGFGVTCYAGSGRDGNIKVLNVICQKSKFHDLEILVQEIDPKVLVASHTLSGVTGGFLYDFKGRLG
jgi:uncharacterized protein YebE (UPF0316 family)